MRNMIRNTANTETVAAVGTDEYMIENGFHPSSVDEMAAYGKLATCTTSAAGAAATRKGGTEPTTSPLRAISI